MALSLAHGTTSYRREVCGLFFERMRVLRNNLGIELLVVGSDGLSSRDMVKNKGHHYLEFDNRPVSNKWNAGMAEIKKHHPTHVIILGSDDFVSDSLIERYILEIENGFDGVMGIYDSYFITLSNINPHFNKCVYWGGYNSRVIIGSAMCVPSRILDALGWSPWASGKNAGLDSFIHRNMRRSGEKYDVKGFYVKDEGWLHIDIKTRGNISSMSFIAPQSPKVDFEELMLSYLPEEEANNIIAYRDSCLVN